jgi:hypothetical protein
MANSNTHVVDLNILNVSRSKIEVLQSIQDPNVVFTKGSVEFRIMTSLFYEFGRELSKVCPYEVDCVQGKSFFSDNIDTFFKLFPNFRIDEYSHLRLSGKTPSMFLKLNARNGFMREKRKALQLQKEVEQM